MENKLLSVYELKDEPLNITHFTKLLEYNEELFNDVISFVCKNLKDRVGEDIFVLVNFNSQSFYIQGKYLNQYFKL